MKYDYDLICIGLGPAGMAISLMGDAMGKMKSNFLKKLCRFFFRLG